MNTELFYCVFINNIAEMLPFIEKNRIPFVFTLYPGGGFGIDDEMSDDKLYRVLSSPYFRQVIVTQKITYDYLISKKFCSIEKIKLIFGGAVPQISIGFNPNKKIYYPNKNTLDICFCASRYTKDGSDKGYPIFIEMMKKISSKYDFTRFHIIGDYNPAIINISGYENKIKFYGMLAFNDLSKVFSKMDIMISPNQPNILSKGAFDGFPLGTVIEAGLNACLIMNTDPNDENFIESTQQYYFIPDREMIIIPAEAEKIAIEIEKLIATPELIKKIAIAGQQKFRTIYNNDNQMEPRLKILKSFLKS